MPIFETKGLQLAFLDEGPIDAGRPPVLLLHGFASNIDMNWVATGWVDTLTRAGYRVIAIDHRGHGQSQKLYRPEDYGASTMARDALALLDRLAVPRAHVLGYSMGARIAAFLALADPLRVARIVFGGLGINMVRGLAGTGPIAKALEAPSIDDVSNPTARTFRAFAEQTKSDLKALAACIRGAREPITAEMLARIDQPALVVVGSEDVIGGSADGLADLLPRGRALTLQGREHMKAVGDKVFKQAVLSFLAETAGGADG